MDSDRFVESLKDEEEVRIRFEREDGSKRTLPVWFVVDGGSLELLPMYGLKTKWFRSVERTGRVEVMGKKESRPLRFQVVKDEGRVRQVKGRFAQKYGESDVRRYYPTSEVALVAVG